MRSRKLLLFVVVTALPLFMMASRTIPAGPSGTDSLTPIEQLGKALFSDTNLSTPPGQACAACHGPDVGFTGPISSINAHGAVYPGAMPPRFGNRKPPSAAYAGDSPVFYFDSDDGTWVGGMFWDGRATGATLGDPVAEQAEGPFLNPLEQNNANAQAVCLKVQAASYAELFKQVWGLDSIDCTNDVQGNYERIARSIAAYERSSEVNPFTSKYDYYLAGRLELSNKEMRGLKLFEDPHKGNCAACHPSEPGPSGEPPLFTDFTYDNLGVPKNLENPFYKETAYNPLGTGWVDLGLGGFLESQGYASDEYGPNLGKFKVATLRNVDKRPYRQFVKAYAHNGYFKSLKEIVHFYNTRDVLPTCGVLSKHAVFKNAGVNCWPAAEVSATVNHEELGHLGLTPGEEEAIVDFLKTLSDGYTPPGR